jgi:hypothetical protein
VTDNTRLIKIHAEDVAQNAVKAGLPDWFCEGWPIAKKAIGLLKKHLPSYLKPIAGFLAAAGNAVYASGCKK